MLMLWAVFMFGPGGTAIPVHHYRPVVWKTEAICREEIARLLDTKAVVIPDPDYHLECVPVPDMTGDPA